MGDIAAEVKIEEISSVKKKLSIEIPWADVKKELDSTYVAFGGKAKVKGFRPGKIPRKVLEVHYREEAEGEAITNLVSKSYADAIRENNIFAVTQPTIDQNGIEKDKNFSFTATVETRPEFEPEDYTDLEVSKKEMPVTDSDVDSRLDQMREMYATLEEVTEDREAREQDFVVVDFEVTVDGKIREELTSKDYMLQIGGGRFLPDFEKELKGMTKGEEKEVNITFPKDYQPAELAEKEGSFTVVLKDIREKKMPEADDEFVKNFDQYETLEDLKADIRKSLEEEAKARVESDLKMKIVDKLIENNEFEVPESWVEQQIYYMMLDTQRRMVSNGMSPDKATEVSMNLHDGFKDQAARLVKRSLLLAKIAEKESIAVEEQDIEERLKEIAAVYGQDYESVSKAYEREDMKERLKDELQEDKTMQFLIEKASVTIEPEGSPDEKEQTV